MTERSGQAEPVLIGATSVHKPFTLTGRWSGDVSTRPGFGDLVKSACGRYEGIVYDRSLDTRNLPMCRWCERS